MSYIDKQKQWDIHNVEKLKVQFLLEMSMTGDLNQIKTLSNNNNTSSINEYTNTDPNSTTISTSNTKIPTGNFSQNMNDIITYHTTTNHRYDSLTAICEECNYNGASWRCHGCDNQIYCHKCLTVLHGYQSPFAHHHAQFLPYYTMDMHRKFLLFYNEKRMEAKYKKTMLYLKAKWERQKLHAIIEIQAWLV